MDEKFTIPKGFEDFISNTDELLEQLQLANSVDKFECRIFLDHTNLSISDDNTFAEIFLTKTVEIYELLINFIDKKSSNYLWHKHKIAFRIVCDSNSYSNTCANSNSSSNSKNSSIYIYGSMEYGENIDDEWYVVYLLIELSKLLPQMNISVNDNDGQFILIEAADYLPDWLGPDSCNNRVWIKNGLLLIIPIDEPGRDSSGGMHLDRALSLLALENGNSYTKNDNKDGNSSTMSGYYTNFVVDRSIRKLLAPRLDVYPARAIAMDHHSVCLLPRKVAQLLVLHPQLLPIAVSAFSEYITDSSTANSTHRKVWTSLKKIFSLKNSNAESAGRFTGRNSCQNSSSTDKTELIDDNSIVAMPVRFTRALFAQILFKNFQLPRKFHAVLRMIQRFCHSNSKIQKLKQALLLGSRICCGLELAYHIQKTSSISESATLADSNSKLAKLETFLGRTVFNPKIKELVKSASLLVSSTAIDTSKTKSWITAVLDNPFDCNLPINCLSIPEDNEEDSEATEFRATMSNTYDSVITLVDSQDSDSWLYMSPEELDKEMLERIKKYSYTDLSSAAAGSEDSACLNCTRSPNYSSDDNDEASSNEIKSMEDAINSFKNFLQGSSDIDGVNFSTYQSNKNDTNTEMSDDNGKSKKKDHSIDAASDEKVRTQEGFLDNIDFDLVQSIIDNKDVTNASSRINDKCNSYNTGDAEKEEKLLQQYFSAEDLQIDEESDSETDSDEDDISPENSLNQNGVANSKIDSEYRGVKDENSLTIIRSSSEIRITSQPSSETKRSANASGRAVVVKSGRSIAISSSVMNTIQASTDERNWKRADDNLEVDKVADSVTGIKKFLILNDTHRNDCQQTVYDSDDEESLSYNNNEDSDAESDRNSNSELDFSKYEDEMDAELFCQDAIANTFRTTVDGVESNGKNGTKTENTGKNCAPTNMDEFDIDTHLLQNLLESHAQQFGTPGPASQFLSQFGLQLPRHPPAQDKK